MMAVVSNGQSLHSQMHARGGKAKEAGPERLGVSQGQVHDPVRGGQAKEAGPERLGVTQGQVHDPADPS